MELSFSDVFLKVLGFSRDEAVRTGWRNISADHVMLAILRHGDNDACRTLEALGADLAAFKCSIDEAVFVDEALPWEERDSVHFCESALSLLQHASLEALRCRAANVGPLHFLLAVSRMSGSYSHDWLDDRGLSLRDLVEASGLAWERYGLAPAKDADGMPSDPSVMLSDSETSAPDQAGHIPDPVLLAEAIERRLREGYTTDNPLVS